jgi:hypothetical protein
MTKSMSERVKDSFDDNSEKEIEKFLDWTLTRVQDYCQSIRRSLTLMVLLIAVFELVRATKGGIITLGSFRISNNSPVLLFIPALAAFLYFQSIIDNRHASRHIMAFQDLLTKWAPKAMDNDLHVLPLGLPVPIYWNNVAGLQKDVHDRRVDNVEIFASLILALTLLVGVLAFEAQAYYLLHSSSTHQNILWLISLVITAFCLLMSALAFFL